jgi:protein gp37
MVENSKIEWTHHTFNGWIGCQHVSPGCEKCYAERERDHRFRQVKWGPHGERKRTSEGTWKGPPRWNREAEKTGKRFRVFCASLSDWLDNRAPQQWRSDLGHLIEATTELDWLLLSKRIENFRKLAPWKQCPSNVWLGVTAEDPGTFRRTLANPRPHPGNSAFHIVRTSTGAADTGPARQVAGLDHLRE